MKVTLEENYKRIYTLEELEQAKVVIAYEKENDEYKPEQWAEILAHEVFKNSPWYMERVLSATAHTCKNVEIGQYERYGEGSGWMDVWVEAIFDCGYRGIVEAHAYLSDIWATGGDYDYRHKMYVKYAKWESGFPTQYNIGQ